MTNLTEEIKSDLQTARRAGRHPGPWRAKIAAPPASGTAMLYVTIPSFDPNKLFGPCRWAARGALLPSKGDDCIVVFDNLNELWVTVWWPS